jgi:predicted GH43/DUF377 family glycosyl hydrolase
MWDKKGVIFNVEDHEFEWGKSHSSFPTALLLDDKIRIYYSTRCHYRTGTKSVISYFDVNREDPTQVCYAHNKPILQPGKLGTFDDCGVQPNCAVHHNKQIYLYYLGWNPGVNILARNNTGLAVSTDGGNSFNRAFEGPILDRTRNEPYFAYTPCVLQSDDQWQMWYSSGTGWVNVNDKAEGLFEIKYAFSKDGIEWTRPNTTCIVPKHEMEVSCRPTVIQHNHLYHMWYSYRCANDFRGGKNSYKIGYATSSDAKHWKRKDDSSFAISNSNDAWDSDMSCFCSVIKDNNKLQLFYNGNGFGKTGIGYASCDLL